MVKSKILLVLPEKKSMKKVLTKKVNPNPPKPEDNGVPEKKEKK